MIFRQWQEVHDGLKTNTRRIKKEGEYLSMIIVSGEKRVKCVFTKDGRRKWYVGQTLAVQPGRGKKGNDRILLLDIADERLQDISFNDMLLEGYPIALFSDNFDKNPTVRDWFVSLWDGINKRAGDQWNDNPSVWALTFELVQ